MAALEEHTINWRGGGTVTNGGLTYEVKGFGRVGPEKHSVFYKNTIITCGGNLAVKKTRFGLGLLMNNFSDETVSDTSFYDDGGAQGAYLSNHNFTKTFYPQVAGDMLK